MSKPGKEELTRFAETVGTKMYEVLTTSLKRKSGIFLNCPPVDAMVTLVNTGLIPLILLSRTDMFRSLDTETFAEHIADQFMKLNAVVTKIPKPTNH
jgi:hypothetical protein